MSQLKTKIQKAFGKTNRMIQNNDELNTTPAGTEALTNNGSPTNNEAHTDHDSIGGFLVMTETEKAAHAAQRADEREKQRIMRSNMQRERREAKKVEKQQNKLEREKKRIPVIRVLHRLPSKAVITMIILLVLREVVPDAVQGFGPVFDFFDNKAIPLVNTMFQLASHAVDWFLATPVGQYLVNSVNSILM